MNLDDSVYKPASVAGRISHAEYVYNRPAIQFGSPDHRVRQGFTCTGNGCNIQALCSQVLQGECHGLRRPADEHKHTVPRLSWCWKYRNGSTMFWLTNTRIPTMPSTSSSTSCRKITGTCVWWVTMRRTSTHSAGPDREYPQFQSNYPDYQLFKLEQNTGRPRR